ncbi:MAG: lipopolysaccharide transport periplasmic protein LptA [Candidatus Deferrimicrobiaceae bacterium]
MREKRGRSGTFRRVFAGGAVFLLLLLSLAVRAGAAREQAGSSPDEPGRQPIEITADHLSADSARESVTFEGNVVARQEDVTLYSDRLYAEYSRTSRAIEKITAEGNVRVIQGGKEARAARAVFYNLEQRIVLTGGADLAQGENVLKGDTVTIYLRENRFVVTGGEGGRVRAVIHPQGLLETKEKENR